MDIRLIVIQILEDLLAWWRGSAPAPQPVPPQPAPEPVPEPTPAPVPDPTPAPVPPDPPAPKPVPTPTTTTRLEAALVKVESGGNYNAIGDKNLTHKAYGPLQIRQPYVDDVNRVLGTKYKAEEMLGNLALSLKVHRAYMKIYATEKRLGRPVTDQDIARIHNGGPNGWKIAATLGYWKKVQKFLA